MLRLAALIAILSWSEAAAAAPKAALVIGNGAYSSVTPLVNPANDADDMAAALGRIGYAVTLVKDGNLASMNDGLRAFLRDADRAESALVFYSGHGVQVKGRNYLIPIDARIGDELDLDTQTVSLDKLLELLDGVAPRVKIVILDSCRDNPLARTLVRGAGSRGLARIDLDASSAKGTLIAFSTSPGSVAQDGSGRNSPFTEALLAHVETPDLDIRQMFGEVRADVDRSTQGAQTPWVNEAIIGAFAMTGQAGEPGRVTSVQPAAPPPEPEPRMAEAQVDPPEPSTKAIAGFVIPDSDRRRLSYDDLTGLSPAQLRIARNEIYARRGRFMKDARLKAYFSRFDWYQPFTWEPSLTPVERANVALIQTYEESP